jgi:uroporphyrinogen III methyltransferase/synthase
MLKALIAHGRPRDDAAALIYNGTLPSQETTRGSIEELAKSTAESNDRRAATLVVGRVVALRDHLRWFDERPLFGKRILVTRSRARAGQLIELLESLGAEPILAPMIRAVPPQDFTALDDACNAVERLDWIVFASANAVDAFIGRLLLSPLDLRALKGVKLCSVGPATQERLAKYGLKVDLTPSEYRAEAVAEALSQSGNVAGLKILVPRSDIGRDVIADELRRQGADVTEATAYRTVAVDLEREGGPDVYGMLLDQHIDVVTFASASAVRNLVQVLGADPAPDLLKTTIVASIGPVTAEAAAQLNIQTTILPSEYTIPALVDAIVEHFRRLAT